MCRFVAYLGSEPLPLSYIVKDKNNSLIAQSSRRNIKYPDGANSDGFGFGWYENSRCTPTVFKSTLPLHKDISFLDLSTKILSGCSVGHIRAATVGEVFKSNCHPFVRDNLLFAHNGTVFGFDDVKKVINENGNFLETLGNTDSEFFLNLMLPFINTKLLDLDKLLEVFRETVSEIAIIQRQLNKGFFSRLNTVFTDGNQLMATRYVSNKNKNCLSLYYKKRPGGIIISSEKLSRKDSDWVEVPTNHAVLVDMNLNLQLVKI